MTGALGSIRFHARNGWFAVQERFSDLAGGIAGFLLFPFFIWLMGKLWGRFNSYQGNYTYEQILLYVGVTEIYFMTFLRPASFTRASGDFSIALARPRSWLATSFSGLFGHCLGSRLIYLGIFVLIMPFLGVGFGETLSVAGRVLIFLPVLGLTQALIGLLFASAQVLWTETGYFILPASKIFLALGGVFGPLADYGEPWRSLLIALPPADLFFQVGHFCLTGSFYSMTSATWIARIATWNLVLAVIVVGFYRYARKHHQSYGG